MLSSKLRANGVSNLTNITKRHFPRKVFSAKEAHVGVAVTKNPFAIDPELFENIKKFSEERVEHLPSFLESTHEFELALKDTYLTKNHKFDLRIAN